MFVTEKQLAYTLNLYNNEMKQMSERYWALWHKHERLLKHLNLYEHEIKETTVLRSKGGPEQPS